ncbi:MAG: helix-turn-helix domain-containing protein, partial [Pseudorhodoplanes sp.]
MSRSKALPLEKTGPLDAQAWIAGALDALASRGIDAVRVEPLAKALAVTKGSFYWHFADRRALIEAMLTQWSEGRIIAIREQTVAATDPAVALRR